MSSEGLFRSSLSWHPHSELLAWIFNHLIPKILKYQSSQGGPIIGVQIENEYGGYGNTDSHHLEWLKNLLISLGITEPLFTSDPGMVFNKENSSRKCTRMELIQINGKVKLTFLQMMKY